MESANKEISELSTMYVKKKKTKVGNQNAILDVRIAWTKSYFVALLALIYKMKFGFFLNICLGFPLGLKAL